MQGASESAVRFCLESECVGQEQELSGNPRGAFF